MSPLGASIIVKNVLVVIAFLSLSFFGIRMYRLLDDGVSFFLQPCAMGFTTSIICSVFLPPNILIFCILKYSILE